MPRDAIPASHDLALVLYQTLGQHLGVAETLNHKGTLLLASGTPQQAEAQYHLALQMAREIDTPLEEARALEGLGRSSPWLAWPMTIAMLALAGIPATSGFIGKFYLIDASVAGDYAWLGIVIVVGLSEAALTA